MWWLWRASLQNLAQVMLEWNWFWGQEAARSSLDSFCFVQVCVNRLMELSPCRKFMFREAMEAQVRFDTCGHCRQVWAAALLPCIPGSASREPALSLLLPAASLWERGLAVGLSMDSTCQTDSTHAWKDICLYCIFLLCVFMQLIFFAVYIFNEIFYLFYIRKCFFLFVCFRYFLSNFYLS